MQGTFGGFGFGGSGGASGGYGSGSGSGGYGSGGYGSGGYGGSYGSSYGGSGYGSGYGYGAGSGYGYGCSTGYGYGYGYGAGPGYCGDGSIGSVYAQLGVENGRTYYGGGNIKVNSGKGYYSRPVTAPRSYPDSTLSRILENIFFPILIIADLFDGICDLFWKPEPMKSNRP
jgi:hypothetical protein